MIATRPSWAVAATAGQAEPEPKLLLATKSWLDAGSTRTDQTAGLVQPGEEKTAVYAPGTSAPVAASKARRRLWLRSATHTRCVEAS